MKDWTSKKWLILLLSICFSFGLLFTVKAYFYAQMAEREADDIKALEMRPARTSESLVSQREFNTDQMLSALSLNVTILGLIVAITAIGLGAMALFGYNELRASTFAKTEIDLGKIIKTLESSGELQAATAAVLLESIIPERVFTVPAMPPGTIDMVQASKNAPQTGQEAGSIAQDYPEERNGERAE